MRRTVSACALLALTVASVPARGMPSAAMTPPHGGGVGLVPHSIKYDLSLSRSTGGDTIDAAGDMRYRVIDMCDSWSSEQRLHLRTMSRDGGYTDTVSDYTTLESKDGSRFTFRSEQGGEGQTPSRIEGEAHRLPDGRVDVVFTRPAAKTITLPKGTMFPLAHTAAIIRAGQKHTTTINPLLFDGTSVDGAFYTFVTMGQWERHPAALPIKTLRSEGAVRATVAFFSNAPGTMVPDFALGARYFSNGVADHISMDFGDFVLQGHATNIKFPEPRRCGAHWRTSH